MRRGTAALAALALVTACDRARPPRATATPPVVARAPDASLRDASPDAPDASPAPTGRCGPWEALGRGVWRRRCDRAGGHAAALLAGWAIRAPAARAWAEALDDARLGALGVSTLFAVEGPAQVDFRGKELDVDGLVRALDGAVGPRSWALVAAHSSGAHVAATLFHRAFARGAARGLSGRVVYVDLDGDAGIAGDPERDLRAGSAAGLRRALFVATQDAARGLDGFSRAAMVEGARRLPRVGELWTYDAAAANCASDACAHLALVDTRPTARGNESYGRSTAATVNVAWLARVEPWLAAIASGDGRGAQ